MGCLNGAFKNVLFTYNFLLVICGITLIAIGGVILAKESQIKRFTDYSVGGIGITIGVIILCIAFLGGCGAIKKNNYMITSYAIALILLFLLQIILAYLVFLAMSNSNDFEDEIQDVVNDVFQKYYADPNNEEKKEAVDHMQQYFECCGVFGPNAIWPKPSPSCYKDMNIEGTLFTKGCAHAFGDPIVHNIKAIATAAIVFAIIEFIGAVVASTTRIRK